MAKIRVGQLWEVVKEGFYTSGECNEFKRPVGLLVGEMIEIRYPYEWHFRTLDGKYWHATADMIIEHCKLIGEVYEVVRMGNRASLEEVWRLKLYEGAQ